MTIPDYIISSTIAEEHHFRQIRQIPNTDLPEPKSRAPRQGGSLTRLRHQLSETLHTIARHIEPEHAASRSC